MCRARTPRRAARAIERLTAEANRAVSEGRSVTPALSALSEGGGIVRAEALYLCRGRGPKLPAAGKLPRVQRLLRELVIERDAALSPEAFTQAMIAMDEAALFTIEEISEAPRLLAMELVSAYARAARAAVAGQLSRERAEEWVLGGALPARGERSDPAFWERALKMLGEKDMKPAREAAERRFGGAEEAEEAVRLAHEKQARERLVLEGAARSLRGLKDLDAEYFLRAVSRADRLLREDPSGTYLAMDDESRAAVRRALGMLSLRSGLSEATVARHALCLAGEGGPDAARRTVCYYLYDDEGRSLLLRRLGAGDARMRAIAPDPEGRVLIFGIVSLAALLLLLAAFWMRSVFLAILSAPICLGFSRQILSAALSRLRPPARLLKLRMENVPEEFRTLVAIPVLLSSPERAAQICGQIEALGCLERDPNIEYLILGDFADADAPHGETDGEILELVRGRIDGMNRAAGRRKYHYLNRNRVYYPDDGYFSGFERKRGAIMALCELLLTGQSAFEAEEMDAPGLVGRFRYLIALDADTRMLPGDAGKLIGAIAHPLNRARAEDGARRGYAILAPRVENSAGSRFQRLMGGAGGPDSYPTAVSNLYQDLCGQGIFGGKGIIDIAAFDRALRGRVPCGRVLSHDLLEGALSGAGFLGDLTIFDRAPASLSSYLKRLERWTRGDWQLLPFLAGRRALSPLYRFLILDNLARSLQSASALLLTLFSFWLGNAPALFFALLESFLPFFLSLPRAGLIDFERALAGFSLLPDRTFACVGAIARALTRMFFTRRGLLAWTPAADAEAQGADGAFLPGVFAALFLLPGLINPGFAPAALGTALLFLLGPGWMRRLAAPEAETLDDAERRFLAELAKRTWDFFRETVPADGCGLPPDNLQLDPPVGLAARSSPTNIGMYLVSCLSALRLGLTAPEEALSRMERTVATVEKLDKWRGQLYNWYDTKTLRPLPPGYVSSVDGGNLAACLLLCAEALRGEAFDGEKLRARALSENMEAIARGMEFPALYDPKRRLFYIGYDPESGRLSDSRYDLIASESRILSFAAMRLGQVPVRHWFSLSRARAGEALLSWSGTMFEYLMSDLFFRPPEGTLLARGAKAVVRLQARRPTPAWGVSESGYAAFDLDMNYQYRAFGLAEISLRGDAWEGVVAPYASALALGTDARGAVRNLMRLRDLGCFGELGFYEAVDLDPARLTEEEEKRIVKSHMAHHQGMILAAICNALTGDSLAEDFMRPPAARALSPLLEERAVGRGSWRRREGRQPRALRPARRETRLARGDLSFPDALLLSGGGAVCLLTADGRGFYMKDGVLADRFRENWEDADDGMFVMIKTASGLAFSAGGGRGENVDQRLRFGMGEAVAETRAGEITSRLSRFISPEDGFLYQKLTVTNRGTREEKIELTGCFAVALCPLKDYRAHPAFQKLFVCAEALGDGALRFTRKSRDGARFPALLYALRAPEGAALSHECDLNKLIGREGSLANARDLPRALTGTAGYTLNPCAALRAAFSLAPGQTREALFVCGFADASAPADEILRRALGPDAPDRARLLGRSRARAMADFLGFDIKTFHALNRAGALLFYPDLLARRESEALPGLSAIWALGISGDIPILTVFLNAAEQLPLLRELLRAHEYYRAAGIATDLVAVDDSGADYEKSAGSGIAQLLCAGPLREKLNESGGAHIVNGAALPGGTRALLARLSAVALVGGAGEMAEQIARQLQSARREAERALPARDFAPLQPIERRAFNGWGGFSPDGKSYCIDLLPGRPTPAPWSFVLAGERFGAIVTERGGGFSWAFNSRCGRLTEFANDPLREGFAETARLRDLESGRAIDLLPGPGELPGPYRVSFRPALAEYFVEAMGLRCQTRVFADEGCALKCGLVTVENRSAQARRLSLSYRAEFLMGALGNDKRLRTLQKSDDLLIARGEMEGVGFACVSLGGETQAQERAIELPAGQSAQLALLLGWAADEAAARKSVRRFLSEGPSSRLESALKDAEEFLSRIEAETPDPLLNAMLGRWLPYQVLAARLRGRAGLYQSGGAYGFRDQLQDALGLLPIDPGIARELLPRFAAHQFLSGDVQHWWHPPRTGVRTRVSDDCLFLPYLTAQYVKETGDRAILEKEIPYLMELEIPPDGEDIYGEPMVSGETGALSEHCLRAIQRAARFGAHGLPLMGTGDWNDGMNRVGYRGAGESVWLAEFLIVVAEEYARACAGSEEEKEALFALAARLRGAVEEYGWDGAWYRRAYYDGGEIMGSASANAEDGCRIDLIAQCWAVAAGLDPARVRTAMQSAWDYLADEEDGIIRLLTPPFVNPDPDPGYIAAYPPGVRENGGQYTHAACWAVMAWALLGQADRAWGALEMLMPYAHADTRARAEIYRAEPYAVAADIYGEGALRGRGGWTWYTGAAGWLLRATYKYLCGLDLAPEGARLDALLPSKWTSLSLTLRAGRSRYRLSARRGVTQPSLDGAPLPGGRVPLIDDGRDHEALFPPREGG